MDRWIACELHTHTVASDGSLTLSELAQTARDEGIECFAITDHNTMVVEENRIKAEQSSGIKIIRGLEWTTFYGHMTILGIKDYIDWRTTGKNTIHSKLRVVHEQGAIAGIAHPYAIGAPLCTGCHWDFKIEDWDDFDYLEVWSEVFPTVREKNTRAFELWTSILNKGHRITAVAGRDWHVNREKKHPITITYVRIDDDTDDIYNSIVQSIKKGKVYLSSGPKIDFKIIDNQTQNEYEVADDILIDDAGFSGIAQIGIDLSDNGHMVDMTMPLQIKIESNLGNLSCVEIDKTCLKTSVQINEKELKWIRAEIYGCLEKIDNTMIAFTNPIYFRCK